MLRLAGLPWHIVKGFGVAIVRTLIMLAVAALGLSLREVSAFSDGIAMQFIRYYHNDYNVTLEEIIECGKLWCRTMIERRSEKTVMLKE